MDLIVDFPSQRPPRDCVGETNQSEAGQTRAAPSLYDQGQQGDLHLQEVRNTLPSQVTVDDQTQVTYVQDISTKHKATLFYTKSELEQAKQAYAHALRQVQLNSMIIPDYGHHLSTQDTTRFLGLESCLSEKSSQQIRLRRKALRCAIEFEQARQERLGIRDDDALADISKAHSEWSRKRARYIAIWHAY